MEYAIAFDPQGNIYVAGTTDDELRRLSHVPGDSGRGVHGLQHFYYICHEAKSGRSVGLFDLALFTGDPESLQ
jgi:hypothetical protein